MWGKTELRKKYKKCDIKHVFDEYSTNINIHRRKILIMKKNEKKVRGETMITQSDNTPKVELYLIYFCS